MKIGFLGGSFDPVHSGHLAVAQDVRNRLALDRMVLVPAAQAPLKANGVQASAEDRLAMLRLAIQDESGLAVDDCELQRPGVSYTIDTVRELRRRYPGDDLYWVIGADQVEKLESWKDAGELVQLVQFVGVARPGFLLKTPEGLAGLRIHQCETRRMDVSSSEIRRRIREGRSLENLCPQKVVAYITEKGLYR